MPAPAGRGEQLEGGLLERPGDEEVVDDPHGAQPRPGRAARPAPPAPPRPAPRAPTAATRSPGAADFVSERRYTTWPSRSPAASGGGGSASIARSRDQSSSIRNAPAAATASSTGSRRSAASDAPLGLANSGWQ